MFYLSTERHPRGAADRYKVALITSLELREEEGRGREEEERVMRSDDEVSERKEESESGKEAAR